MIHKPCPIRCASPDDEWHYWFGYYDKCPWSPDGTRLLAHRARFCDRFPAADDVAEVGWIEDRATDAPRFVKIGETHAWNWQQGAMLAWVNDGGAAHAVRFNDRAGTELVARQVALDELTPAPNGAPGEVVGPAVYARHATGAALTLSFGRLTRLRKEYGYSGVIDARADDPHPADDGIYRVDGSEKKLIISIDQLDRNVVGDGARAGGDAHQHVNHLMFNPSGTRFCFMHRFERTDGILQSRLFTSDLEGKDVRLLFEGMCSHYDWRDDRTILAWAGRRALLGSAGGAKTPVQRAMSFARRGLKPVYYALGKPRILMNRILKDSYLLITDVDVREADAAPPTPFAPGELTCDGHCTFNRGGVEPGRWVLTDGYPDMKSRQPLFLWDCRANDGYEIGRYPTPRCFDGPIRVDLHPRFNRNATRVCIDSAMDGSRKIYVVDVSVVTQENASASNT